MRLAPGQSDLAYGIPGSVPTGAVGGIAGTYARCNPPLLPSWHVAHPAVSPFHSPARFPRGFRCASRNVGLKPTARDLTLFVSEVEANAAAVFTRNHFPGAPIILGRETIKGGRLRAIVANSKCSNVATGEEGVNRARRMAEAAAAEVGTTADRVLVSSTGVIGVPLAIEKIETGIRGMIADLSDDPALGAEGIMTTDTHPKALSVSVGEATITCVAKGSGMIEPNMATMLAYIFTDAALDSATLDRMLRSAVHVSFNMLSVDTDTSTSDTCAILANGLAGAVDEDAFQRTLTATCLRMTEILARDGEGAEHLIRATVRGARSEDEARRVAKSLVNSPLVKTMVHGADPNVGRLLMAVGKCFEIPVDASRTDAWINGVPVVRGGMRLDFEDAAVRATLASEDVQLTVELGLGAATATAYGCDLTKGYVEENAAYYSS
jgi:glutamate N-acetyltransferase / amino-acid N-acetyltransferase